MPKVLYYREKKTSLFYGVSFISLGHQFYQNDQKMAKTWQLIPAGKGCQISQSVRDLNTTSRSIIWYVAGISSGGVKCHISKAIPGWTVNHHLKVRLGDLKRKRSALQGRFCTLWVALWLVVLFDLETESCETGKCIFFNEQ